MSISKNPLKNGHIILDTNFIIKAYQNIDTPYFDNIFTVLKDNNCTPIINEYIKFEFLRGCKKSKQFFNKLDYLKALSEITLKTNDDICQNALEIANIYSNKNINKNQISIVDIYNSAFLKKYNKNITLITTDYNDYPIYLHNRFKVDTVDTEKEILTLVYFEFDISKYEKCIKDFNKTN